MWTAQHHSIDENTTRITLHGSAGPLSFDAVIDLWRESAAFRSFFTPLLTTSPFQAFFWETPPVTAQTLVRPFEFVLVQSSALTRLHPDPSPFRAHFAAHPSASVLHFPNLGGDAILVVPAPQAPEHCYTHLARFLRDAPPAQVDEFWQTTARALRARLSDRPLWLSTAGMGVSWLHLRLDSRPKYYRYKPYTAPG